MKKRFLVPLGIFAVLVVFLGIGLTLDPREVPSPFIGKPAPQFSLNQLHHPDKVFTPDSMRGKVWLLNVWASWCVSCRAEHKVVTAYARQGEVDIIGLNYKDKRSDALGWLQQFGDPYLLSVSDLDGRVGIDFGVYGVPETFVIDKKGIIRYKQIGPVTHQVIIETIGPLVKQLQGEPA